MRATAGRIAQALPSLVGASLIVWSLLLLAPGDPARRVLNARGVADPTDAQIAATRAALRLDESPVVRYVYWLGDVLRGDLGTSWRTGRPVAEEFLLRLPSTGRLAVTALVLALLIALVLAVVPVLTRASWLDQVARAVTMCILVVPSFLVALALIDVVVLRVGLGRVLSDGSWRTVGLPAITLALPAAATWSRILRASLLEANSAMYLQVCAARGASRTRRVLAHALPNASAPFLTVAGIGVAGLLGGAPIAESIFNWPGVGRFTIDAIIARDVPVVQGFALISVATYIVVSLLVDLLLGMIDPRLRVPRRKPSRQPIALLRREKAAVG